MTILKRCAFAGLTVLALAIIACGESGDGSGLPPAGEQRFTVTGTMEVEFLEEGVSAGPIALQETETGEVSGSLTSVFNEDGSLTITQLGITVDFGDKVFKISQGDEPSTGNVGPDGTTVSLNVEAAVDTDEPVPSDGPIELESDDKLGVDSGVTLNTPEDAEPLQYGNPVGLMTIIQIFMLVVKADEDDREWAELLKTFEAVSPAEETAEAEAAQENTAVLCDEFCTELTDPPGDEVSCDFGQQMNDPAADIRSIFVTQTEEGDLLVQVGLGAPPTDSFGDFNFSVLVGVASQAGLAQIHNGVEDLGLFGAEGFVEPGTEDSVSVMPDGVYILLPGPFDPGMTLVAQATHQATREDMLTCDEFRGDLPVPCGGECTRED